MQASTDAGFHRHSRSQQKSFFECVFPDKNGRLSPRPSKRNLPLGRVHSSLVKLSAFRGRREKPCLMVRAVDGVFMASRTCSTAWALEEAGHKTGPSMATALFQSRRVIVHWATISAVTG